ncbi:hypothetical protein [Hymenobacter psychrophilus]|uniref:Uncharacterized protein n=1 Tax=Hymenobacter psychrophilus TaxID=651662 RepID=A0A1H3DF48_9BACT|nr:hypothetical protein [Hymenobacter psychrophilus]SDX64977.1 hypothetical protein SAMN04488069_102335 [Hymenobacter psychrophilus]
MKTLLLVALLACTSPAVFAQKAIVGTTTPDKNDNTLVLELPEEGAAAWQRVARVLADRGYPFAHSDVNLLALTTAFNPISRTASLSVSALVRGHQLILRGRLEAITVVGSPSQIVAVRRSAPLGGESEGWQELELIARELGGPVRYARLTVR